MRERLLILGDPDPVHVGAHLLTAARSMGLPAQLLDHNSAFAGCWPIVKFNWHLRGHRPTLLKEFGSRVVKACEQHRPRWILSTGLSPIPACALEAIGKLGVLRMNYLTDNPWNP